MASNRPPVLRLSKRIRQLVTVAGLCVLLQAAAADALRGLPSSDSIPGFDAAEHSRHMIRIKRLRLADPESREVMLAARGLACSDRRAS